MPGEWPVSPAFMRMQSSTAILRQSKRSRSNGVSLGAKKAGPDSITDMCPEYGKRPPKERGGIDVAKLSVKCETSEGGAISAECSEVKRWSCDQAFPQSPGRLIHPCLGKLAPSSFCRNGSFRFPKVPGGLSGRQRGFRSSHSGEGSKRRCAILLSFGLRRLRSFSRPPLSNDLRSMTTYPDSRNR